MVWNAGNGSVPIGTTEMDYVSFGNGGKTLVLLPGLSDGLFSVKGKALILAPSYKRFFKDFTVYMFSRKRDLPETYSIREMAEDQAEAMRKLGIENACVLGVSEGGMIAQCLAVDHPELVGKLVLAVTAPKANDTVKKVLERWIGFAKQGNHKSLMTDTAEYSYSEAYLKRYRKVYPFIGHIGKPEDYKRFLINAEAVLRFDVSEELPKIICPVLIIAGEKDRIVGVQASCEMNEKIAGSRLIVYPDYGHGAYEEAKDFYTRVYDFIK